MLFFFTLLSFCSNSTAKEVVNLYFHVSTSLPFAVIRKTVENLTETLKTASTTPSCVGNRFLYIFFFTNLLPVWHVTFLWGGVPVFWFVSCLCSTSAIVPIFVVRIKEFPFLSLI